MVTLKNKGYFLKDICSMLGITRQSYYQKVKRDCLKASIFNDLESIVIKNRQTKSRAGLRSIFHKEQLHSTIGLNRFENEMSYRGLSLKPYKSYIKTTDSRGNHHKYDNLISGMSITAENQVIVGDITYYYSNSILFYIFHFIDFYTLEIKALVGNINMQGINAEMALRQLLNYNNKNKYNYNLILHTDGGGQYRSNKFQEMLKKAQIRPSQAKNCLENGLSERVNGIIKNEYLIDYDIRTKRQLDSALKKIKYQINNVWPSKRLNYETPKQFARKVKEMSKKDRPVINIKEVT